MQHPDEGTIHAWVDGELTAEESAALEAHLSECAECSALAAEARGLVAASSRIVSALDIVPGGVIPKTALRPRPWYMSTQLRAAAAVVIVAGASLLVMRNGGETKMERAVQAVGPVVATAPSATPVASAAPEAEVDQPRPPSPLLKQKSGTAAGADLRKREVANDAAASLHDEIAATKPEAPVDSVMRRRFNEPARIDQLVVTGVATASSGPPEFKKVRVDSATNTTVYEASPGVEVMLVDRGLRAAVQLRASATAQSKESQATAPQAPAPSPPAAERVLSGKVAGVTAGSPVNSISWRDKRGHQMMLTGPLSKEELEALRKRLPADQR